MPAFSSIPSSAKSVSPHIFRNFSAISIFPGKCWSTTCSVGIRHNFALWAHVRPRSIPLSCCFYLFSPHCLPSWGNLLWRQVWALFLGHCWKQAWAALSSSHAESKAGSPDGIQSDKKNHDGIGAGRYFLPFWPVVSAVVGEMANSTALIFARNKLSSNPARNLSLAW